MTDFSWPYFAAGFVSFWVVHATRMALQRTTLGKSVSGGPMREGNDGSLILGDFRERGPETRVHKAVLPDRFPYFGQMVVSRPSGYRGIVSALAFSQVGNVCGVCVDGIDEGRMARRWFLDESVDELEPAIVDGVMQ